MTTSLHQARRATTLALVLAFSVHGAAGASTAQQARKFDFGPQPAAGATSVPAQLEYSAARGYGFEPGAQPGKPSFFSVDLPEGNYDVTVTLGGTPEASVTTIKSELRRLMLENVRTAPGKAEERTFTVNIRTPQIPAGAGIAAGAVKLKAPRETVQEAWNWDRRLTLEFNGAHPAVRAIAIKPAQAPTLFLLGDSTVCDQPGEPYASWGQMLPRFLKPGIAVANHGESGETYRDSLNRRRLDKVLSAMRPGDTVLMQFGHNDQKQIKDGKGGPFTTYKAEIKQHIDGIRAHGGVPVIVSSMERRAFDAGGRVVPSLIDYANAARQSAQELGVAFIDLNAMSKPLYEALGVEQSKAAFAAPEPGRIDNTHHNNYGSYQLAQAVLAGLRQAGVPAASYIADGYGNYDPAKPDPVAAFAVPPSPTFTNQRPLGDEAHAEAYVFAYFTKNGEDGLHLAASTDGYRWEKLGNGRSYLTPKVGVSKLLRDPCITRGPDGTYHMVWTSGWNENNIGYASSKDLVNWSEQKELPVMAHEKGVLNAWAPEIIYDEQRGEFLIFWASTVPGRFPATEGSSEEKYNHRLYATTTRDFASFTPTRLFYDPGFSVIDATLVRANGQHHLLVKDETVKPPRKYLQLAGAPSLSGPFGAPGAPISPQGLWVEGPTAVQAGADTIVYYDAYRSKHYGAMRSRDLVTWEDVTAKMRFPDEGTPLRMRHGTALAVPAALVEQLRAPPSVPADEPSTVASDVNYKQRLSYQVYFADYMAMRRKRPAQLVFIGDSITEQFRWGAGAPVWNRRFEHRAFDFGSSADKTQHVLWRLQNFDLSYLKPKVAIIMIGTNNVQDSPEQIAAGVNAVVAATRTKFPGVKIALVSILPNSRAEERMAATNKLLAPMADGKSVYYLNLAARFLPQGDNWLGLSKDKLHLTADGYGMWADELEALLTAISK